MRELATKLESCPEGHRFSPLISNALKVYSSKEKMFEEPIQVVLPHCPITCKYAMNLTPFCVTIFSQKREVKDLAIEWE